MLAVRPGVDLAAAVPFYGSPRGHPENQPGGLLHHGEINRRLAAAWLAYDQALSAFVPHLRLDGFSATC
jgi:carboxymethylenebutenolidase